MLRCLVVMRIEAAELHDKISAGCTPRLLLSADDPGHGLQRSRERIVRQLVCHRIEILRRIRDASRTGRQHRTRQTSPAPAIERLITTSYSLAKRFVSSAVRIDGSAFDPSLLPKQRLRQSRDRDRACRSHVELKRRLPGKKQRDSRR